jgi:hypothetical protein
MAQQDRKGSKIIYLSAGITSSNLLNSEAPHKINIYGSDIRPAVLYPTNVTTSLGYFDYSTHILKDIKTGFSLKAGIEYFLKNNWSVATFIAYEDKGIDLNFKHSQHRDVINPFDPSYNIGVGPTFYVEYYEQFYHVKIRNSYVTIPVIVKRYFFNENFYLSAGGYAGWLIKSGVYTFMRKHRYSPDYQYFGSDFYAGIDENDEKKEFTNHFDYGLAIGTGFAYPLTTNFQLNIDLLLSAGLRKIDKKYNNEYEESHIAMPTGVGLRVRSTNYFGLSSDATNLSAAFTFGVGYKLP